MRIRPLTLADMAPLGNLDPSFVSETVLEVRKVGAGLAVAWSLHERQLAQPFAGGRRYDLLEEDRRELQARLQAGDGLYLVAEEAGRLVGLLDLERQRWNKTGFLWSLLVDRSYRRRGLGRRLFERATRWARRRGLRAILLETQSNNGPACHFYAALGCELVGLNDVFYSNEDLALGEVVLFWAYRLDAGAPAEK